MPNPSLGVLCQTKLSNCGSFRSSPAFRAVFACFNNAFNFSIELRISWAVDVLWLSELPIRGIWNSMTDKLQLKLRDHSLCCHIANLSHFKDIWPVKHYYQERSNLFLGRRGQLWGFRSSRALVGLQFWQAPNHGWKVPNLVAHSWPVQNFPGPNEHNLQCQCGCCACFTEVIEWLLTAHHGKPSRYTQSTQKVRQNKENERKAVLPCKRNSLDDSNQMLDLRVCSHYYRQNMIFHFWASSLTYSTWGSDSTELYLSSFYCLHVSSYPFQTGLFFASCVRDGLLRRPPYITLEPLISIAQNNILIVSSTYV